MQTTNIEQRSVNLYDYIMENYVKYFDLTAGRNMELMYILGTCHAKSIRVADFREIFDLQEAGFFEILKFIATVSNLERIAQYGTMCVNDELSQREQVAAVGKTI